MSTLVFALALALVAPPALGAEPATPAQGELRIEVGRQQVLETPGLTRASIGDPSVADVRVVAGKEVLVTGLAPGRTSLILWYGERREERQVVVTSEAKLREVEGMMDVLGLKGLTARQAGRKIAIRGDVTDLQTWERLSQLKDAEPGLVDLTRISPEVFDRIAKRVTDALHAAGLENAQARAVRGTIFLEGTVSDEAERAKAEKIAKAIYSEVTPNLETK